MKNANSFKKILIGLSVAVVLILISYYFIFANIKSKNEHISELKTQVDSQSKKQDYVISINHALDTASASISRVDRSIVSSDGDIEFIEDLENLAKENGLTIGIDSLSFDNNQKPVANAGMTLFKIRAKTSGSWVGTYKLISEIESLPFKVKIENLTLSTSVDESTGMKKASSPWQSKFDITVLKYK